MNEVIEKWKKLKVKIIRITNTSHILISPKDLFQFVSSDIMKEILYHFAPSGYHFLLYTSSCNKNQFNSISYPIYLMR